MLEQNNALEEIASQMAERDVLVAASERDGEVIAEPDIVAGAHPAASGRGGPVAAASTGIDRD